jgi:hypothetical protein
MSKVLANITLVGLALVGGLILSSVLAYYAGMFRLQPEFTVEAYAVANHGASAIAVNVYNVGQLAITGINVEVNGCSFACNATIQPGRSYSTVVVFDRPLVKGEVYALTVTAYAPNGASKAVTVGVKVQ